MLLMSMPFTNTPLDILRARKSSAWQSLFPTEDAARVEELTQVLRVDDCVRAALGVQLHELPLAQRLRIAASVLSAFVALSLSRSEPVEPDEGALAAFDLLERLRERAAGALVGGCMVAACPGTTQVAPPFSAASGFRT